VKIDPECSLRTFIPVNQTIQWLITLSTSYSVSKMSRTTKAWMEMSHWEKMNYRREVWIFICMVFNITYFSHQLFTQSFMSCLSNKLRKWDLKFFLITDIISINTYCRLRPTYDEFQNSTNLLSQGESHTQNYLHCWKFLKQKKLPQLYTTVTTWNKLNTYTINMIT
jgi:hypothetical protein